MRNKIKPSKFTGDFTPVMKITAFMLVFSAVSFASSYSAGQPEAIFRLPAGAWASGMGGAVTADPDYMMSWYNPSRLPHIRDRRASFGGGYRSLGRTEAWGSCDFRVPPRVGMGISFVYRGDPAISGLYDGYYDGGEAVEERALKNAAWTAVSMKIGVGYLMSRNVSIGGAAAVNHQSLPTTPAPNGLLERSSVTSIGTLDIAGSYRIKPNWILSASVKNLLSSHNSWYIYSPNAFAPIIDEVVPPVFVLGSSRRAAFLERELTWNADAVIFLIDGEGAYIGRPEMAVAAGAQWKFTEEITLRAGFSDIELNGDIYRSSGNYLRGFSPRVTMGFSYVLSGFAQGVTFNYAIMTDRIWAGVDQQVDITVSF